jgi:hypothetical protein
MRRILGIAGGRQVHHRVVLARGKRGVDGGLNFLASRDRLVDVGVPEHKGVVVHRHGKHPARGQCWRWHRGWHSLADRGGIDLGIADRAQPVGGGQRRVVGVVAHGDLPVGVHREGVARREDVAPRLPVLLDHDGAIAGGQALDLVVQQDQGAEVAGVDRAVRGRVDHPVVLEDHCSAIAA